MSDYKVVAPPLSQLQEHKSEKWRTFGPEILPLPVAEMDYPIAQPIKRVLIEMINESDLGYLGPIPEVGISFKGFAKRRWNWDVETNFVHMATDVGVAVVELLRVLTVPGDRVLLNSPVYQNFYSWLNEVKVAKVDIPFLYKPEFATEDINAWTHDWDSLEKAYASGVKVHLLCSPHNPLGRIHTAQELQRIADLALKHGVIVISDEIHAPLTYVGEKFVPFLSLGDVTARVGITVTAASKGWNIAGLKCAMILTQSQEMDDRVKSIPPAVHYRASILGAFATAAAFEKGEVWLDTVIANLDINRNLIATLIEECAPAIKYHVPQNSYLAWLDLSGLHWGEDPTATLLERSKVALNSGNIYAADLGQYSRLNFATSPEIITEVFHRIAAAI